MTPHEFIFRGDLTQFWHLVHGIWQRARENGEQPPFELSADSQTPPGITTTVILIFYTQDRNREALSLFADAAPDSDTTILTIFYNEEAFQESGQPARQAWEELRDAWRKDGLLVDPRAQGFSRREGGLLVDPRTQSFSRHTRGPHSRTTANIQRLREIREVARRENRPIPARQFAMHTVGISPKTWRQHAPSLWACWYDPAIPTPQAEPPELQS